jgi:ribosomal protein L37AE/L43A
MAANNGNGRQGGGGNQNMNEHVEFSVSLASLCIFCGSESMQKEAQNLWRCTAAHISGRLLAV